MKTAVISIGNSDDKLTQKEWSLFISDLYEYFVRFNYEIHFHGLSPSSAPWQNATWIISLDDGSHNPPSRVHVLRTNLGYFAKKYGQDSIALLVGDTEFVEASQ